ncbi:MAG: hypothetical protein ABI609_03015 [Acidobacteriota bacterium]
MKLRPLHAVAVALVTWSLVGLVGQTRELRARSLAPGSRATPGQWRLASRGRERLERCLRAALPLLPENSLTALETPPADNGYLYSWVQYVLPERRFTLGSDDPLWQGVSHVFSYGAPLQDRRLRLGQNLGCGWLYEVRPRFRR